MTQPNQPPSTSKDPSAASHAMMPDGPLPARVIAGQPEPAVSIEELMARFHTPAVSVAVVDEMEIRWAKAWGTLQRGGTTAATPDTLFQTASISKPVAAVGALALVREGLLDLDADIETVLDDWHLPRDEYEESVTLRQLLSHSAGTSTPGFEGYAADGPLPTLEEMLDGRSPANSAPVRLVTTPGTAFHYSGGGYLIVQKMMETVTGDPFAQIMRERVFAPLKMEDSHYAPLDSVLHGRAASGHAGGSVIPGKGPVHAESTAGGFWSTPSDLVRLMMEVMRAYKGVTGPVLNPEIVGEILKTAFWNFGLGFRVLGEGPTLRLCHGGATRGWHGQVHAYPERGQSVAVLTNDADGYAVWPQVERGIARSLKWPGWEPEVVEPRPVSESEMVEYTGTYGAGSFEFEVGSLSLGGDGKTSPVRGIGLFLDAMTWTAVPTEPDVFELLEFEGQVAFKRGEEGAIVGLDTWFGQPDWSPYRSYSFERRASKGYPKDP